MTISGDSALPGDVTLPGTARRVLVRRPVDILAEGEITHIDRVPIDLGLARAQWDGYVAALQSEGWAITEVDPAPDQPDSVFIEDAVILFGDTAVLASPGAPSRRGETAGAEAAVRALGLTVRRIDLPGTLDGGDVLKVGATVYVGQSLRTNAEGAAQLATIVEPLGYTVVPVPVTRALHLKTAITALPDGTIIGYPPLVDDPGLFERFVPVPEAEGTAVVVLDAHTLLMSAAAPRTTELLTGLGYRAVTVDITEFEKLEGCVTCLSVRVR
ncbi:N(G),N(G)-dimethylarginine dimethylaminohydrolase [Cryobacterium sp. LW097]|uniref:dimethylargininase n=1 Tax=Cryobacterium sp. LW097 TaxID=1978566 RepID=UPI000B4CBA8A|nr:dimethylargininase [Cryobacterium sp. LW097]ASD23060.1 N(G),N(G)-dimethylarginine dimethylaminohydrolase [Cryobacterium sp. LW097]